MLKVFYFRGRYMKKTFQLSILLILILTMAVAVLGCTKKTLGKTTTSRKQTGSTAKVKTQ